MPMEGDVRKLIRSLNGSVTIDCREDVSELFIDPVQIVDLDTPIHVCQLFGCCNVRFSVLNDQNAARSRTEHTPLHWGHSEVSLLLARRRIMFTFLLFFFAAAAHLTPYRESMKRLIDSSWPRYQI